MLTGGLRLVAAAAPPRGDEPNDADVVDFGVDDDDGCALHGRRIPRREPFESGGDASEVPIEASIIAKATAMVSLERRRGAIAMSVFSVQCLICDL